VATIDLTTENFDETLSGEGITLIDFWAGWCGPCIQFAPIYEQVSEKHDDLTFGKIDTEDQQELAGAFQIRSIPTLMIVRDGVMVFRQAGVLPEAALQDLIQQVRDLDMDEVRREIEEHEAEHAAQAS
jgi:thioredoxin 1